MVCGSFVFNIALGPVFGKFCFIHNISSIFMMCASLVFITALGPVFGKFFVHHNISSIFMMCGSLVVIITLRPVFMMMKLVSVSLTSLDYASVFDNGDLLANPGDKKNV
jgi:hypothetical protein